MSEQDPSDIDDIIFWVMIVLVAGSFVMLPFIGH